MFYKKLPIFITATVLLLAGWGCAKNQTANKTALVENPTAPTETNLINGQTVFLGEEFSFSYPTDWGPIILEKEGGRNDWQNNPPSNENNCTVEVVIKLAGINDLLGAAHNTSGCDPAGRGGWFGDQAKAFTDWDKITEWCGSDCEIFINSNGLKVAHKYQADMEIWGETYKEVDEYAIYNLDSEFHGLIISNERLIKSGLGRSEKELRALIDSIKFE